MSAPGHPNVRPSLPFACHRRTQHCGAGHLVVQLAATVDRQPRVILRDGLYRVCNAYLCAGFVIEGGRITACAPILRGRLDYWQSIAVRVFPTLQS